MKDTTRAKIYELLPELAEEERYLRDGGGVLSSESGVIDLTGTLDSRDVIVWQGGVVSDGAIGESDDRWADFFDHHSLFRLVRSLNELEDSVFDSASRYVERCLRASGFEHDGTRWAKRGDRVHVLCSRTAILGGLQLNIILDNCRDPLTNPVVVPDVEIGGIGRLHKVSVVALGASALPEGPLAEGIARHVRAIYAVLERVFVRKVNEANRNVFARVYDHMCAHLRAHDHGHLVGQFWMSFGAIEEDVIFYFMDDDTLRAATHHFRSRRGMTFGRSPLDLLCSIVTRGHSVARSLSIEALNARKPRSVAFVRARYADDSPTMYLSEVKLYASDRVSTRVPAREGHYYLAIGCPPEIEDAVQAAAVATATSLKRTLEKELPQFIRYLERLNSEVWLKKPESTGFLPVMGGTRKKTAMPVKGRGPSPRGNAPMLRKRR